MKKIIVATFTLESSGSGEPNGSEIATHLEALLGKTQGNAEPWMQSTSTVYMTPPVVIVNITGGLLQGASAEIPTEVITIDYDPGERCQPIPQDNGSISEGLVGNATAMMQPGWVRQIAETLLASDTTSDDGA